MFVWAPIPEPYRELGSLEFAVKLTREANVAVSPGVGFGPGGEGYVRFALVENEQRIGQAVRGIRRALPELAAAAALARADAGGRSPGRLSDAEPAVDSPRTGVPRLIAQTIRDWPRRASPAAKTPSTEVA